MADIDVTDKPDENRFVYTEDDHVAQLVYRVNGDRLVLTHTEVPDELGGRGIAGELVRAAVNRARSSGETIVPWCPYARSWIEKHPDEVAGLTLDLTPPPDSP